MSIKINNKIISIPPYLSTSWAKVAALHMEDNRLAITLTDGPILYIPDLSLETIQMIFDHHASYLENETMVSKDKNLQKSDRIKDMLSQVNDENSMKLTYGTSLENLGLLMEHNPEQANGPDLDAEILEKIRLITEIMNPGTELLIPPAVENCNCFHCQISRAIQKPSHTIEVETIDDDIKEEDLNFQQWEIEDKGNQLFTVTSRLDQHETYTVFLGKPVGCTCGHNGCEHILAVLKS